MSDSAAEFIPQMRPLFGAPEKAELAAYLDEDGFFTEFERTAAFERCDRRVRGSASTASSSTTAP
jgi:perosamine synthetase